MAGEPKRTELRADVLLLKAENQELRGELKQLRQQVAELTSSLNQELDNGARVRLEREVAELRKQEEMATVRETVLRAHSQDREKAHRQFLTRTLESIKQRVKRESEPKME